ncbi:MAG: FtsX-like permease family protein [Thermodesulfobacteriota bacterium]|nr:FtsX-like permease family protein [Thermodesulfobacteriota bacterium]
MTLKDIAIKNLMRRKGKAFFVLAGLVIGVATVVGIISFIEAMTRDINHKLEKFGANILIVPETKNLPLVYGGMNLGGVSFEAREIDQSGLSEIRTIKNAANIAAVGPVVLGTVVIEGKKVLMAGIDFDATHVLKPWWEIKGAAPSGSEVIAGADAAETLNLSVNQIISVNGELLRVAGILASTGSQDDHLVFTALPVAQNLLNKKGVVSMVEVAALCNACPIDEMVNQISGKLPGARTMAIQQVVKGRMETLGQFTRFSYLISGIVVVIGGMIVLVTFMGSVRERTREIGIFRAIGFRKKHVMGMTFMEAGILSVLGGIIGYGLGFGATWIGAGVLSEGLSKMVAFDLTLAVGALSLAVIVGLAASAYPAFMAAQMDPNQALQTL